MESPPLFFYTLLKAYWVLWYNIRSSRKGQQRRRTTTTKKESRRKKKMANTQNGHYKEAEEICGYRLRLYKGRWYGFDIDGTMAENYNHGWAIEKPVKPIVKLMKELHRRGYDVRILSGRTGDYRSDDEIPEATKRFIWAWCDEHLGFRPTLTGRKDSMMEVLFDDRAKQVVCNEGVLYEDMCGEMSKYLEMLKSLLSPKELAMIPKKDIERMHRLIELSA